MIFTKWVSLGVGITENGDYYELATGKKLNREYFAGAIYYRAVGSSKRYSFKKLNENKILKKVEIIEMPF